MKNVYIGIMIISLFCISGDSPSFWGWLVWEMVWGTAFVFSAYKLERMMNHDNIRGTR